MNIVRCLQAPKGVLKNAKCPKFKHCDNSETLRGYQLLLITNRKSHTGFRLIPTSMTLNGVIALILFFSLNSMALLANYVTVVEDRLIMSVNIVSQFKYSTFGHN